jgi:hypothetical protein
LQPRRQPRLRGVPGQPTEEQEDGEAEDHEVEPPAHQQRQHRVHPAQHRAAEGHEDRRHRRDLEAAGHRTQHQRYCKSYTE